MLTIRHRQDLRLNVNLRRLRAEALMRINTREVEHRRAIERMRHRPIPARIAIWIYAVGLACLICLMVLP